MMLCPVVLTPAGFAIAVGQGPGEVHAVAVGPGLGRAGAVGAVRVLLGGLPPGLWHV